MTDLPARGASQHLRIAAIVLAAGRSRRFGADNKLLADLKGRPLIRYPLEAVRSASFDDLIVVTGTDATEVHRIAEDVGGRVVTCTHPGDGPGPSIAAGITALDPAIGGALVLPGDMPFVSADGLRPLVAAFRAHGGARIVYAATSDGQQRNPVIWPRAQFGALMQLDGSGGGKAILRQARPEPLAVPVADPWALFDVDEADDLVTAAEVLSARSSIR